LSTSFSWKGGTNLICSLRSKAEGYVYALLESLDLLPYLILSIVTGYTVLCLECPVPSTSAEELVPKDEELPVASASILELKHL